MSWTATGYHSPPGGYPSTPGREYFPQGEIDAVIHLGVVHNFRISSEELYVRNIIGTNASALRQQLQCEETHLAFPGDVYGPTPGNSHFINEDAPLMASQRFPETRSIVAVDRAVQSFFWRHHDIETVILRPAHIVGPNVKKCAFEVFAASGDPYIGGV